MSDQTQDEVDAENDAEKFRDLVAEAISEQAEHIEYARRSLLILEGMASALPSDVRGRQHHLIDSIRINLKAIERSFD